MVRLPEGPPAAAAGVAAEPFSLCSSWASAGPSTAPCSSVLGCGSLPGMEVMLCSVPPAASLVSAFCASSDFSSHSVYGLGWS